jgi:diguanylate cyclase (GGDEF)-like protein/PAS domain S-box-containing protein
MWSAIGELMEQFEEAVIVLDSNGKIAVVNAAARAALPLVSSLDQTSGIRILRSPMGAEEIPAVNSSAHLDQASSNLPVVLAIRSNEKYLYTSPNFERIYGSLPDGYFEKVEDFLKVVHPDDRVRVKSHLDADSSGAAQEYECRIRHPKGSWRLLRIKVHPFLDSASGQMLVASLAEDITGLQPPPIRTQTAPGLCSMAEFRRALDQSVDQWAFASDAPFFAVGFIDVVRFRAVNDSFGYSEGDRLLEELGRRLSQLLPGENRVAGFGSDRFGILIRSAATAAQAEELLRAALAALSAPVVLTDSPIQIAARAGLAFPRAMDDSADALLRNADAALQLAKRGRESLVVSTISRASKSQEQASLEFDLASALDNDEFFFEFQPVFDPATGNLQLLEALVRWRHPRLGLISPSSFISLAEDSGLVLRLDMQGLERLARQLDYWRTTHPEILEVPVSINISGRHFPNFVMEEQFHNLLRSPAIQASKIIFEITESVFVDSNPGTAAGLERLRAAGVQIWLDDFGDGYSSFRYLAHFPVDGIKISESLVKHCDRDEKSRVILSSLQTLARGLGVRIVVEGVENVEQFNTLYTMGFDALQGYYLSKPLDAKDIPPLVKARHNKP